MGSFYSWASINKQKCWMFYWSLNWIHKHPIKLSSASVVFNCFGHWYCKHKVFVISKLKFYLKVKNKELHDFAKLNQIFSLKNIPNATQSFTCIHPWNTPTLSLILIEMQNTQNENDTKTKAKNFNVLHTS